LAYELKIVQGSVVTVTVGVLAGAETTTGLGAPPPGTPGGASTTASQPQKYIIADGAATGVNFAGQICTVLPNPP
ncbi:MAG: hypothetical protein KIT87_25160, partial [Anaerolineae bacterium]|nr:hypothetical protein [Anaerolineae bacterium]